MKSTPKIVASAAIVSCVSLAAQMNAFAQSGEVTPPAETAVITEEVVSSDEMLSPLSVVGSEEQVFELVGSAAFVSEEVIRSQNYQNVNRILARVPGVYVREEDGYGNFPNISMRGANGERSEKVTMMEDGILTAPAPYSAPAAYYSPRAGRMSGIEILKGSSQVRFGPQTTGGVVNFLSTNIPDNGPKAEPVAAAETTKGGKAVAVATPEVEELDTVPNFYWRSTYGTDNTFFNHAYYGDTLYTDAGAFGYLLELHQHSSDGFRNVDGGGDSGFMLIEPMLKLSWTPNTAMNQRIEFKYGYSDFDADETYVGLTEKDVRENPYRRYSGTKYDNMQSEQHRTYLKYHFEPTDNSRFEVAGYYNEFKRNWYKIRKADGESIHKVLANPAKYGSSFAALTGSGSEDPTTLGIRANNRSHKSYGVQAAGDVDFNTGTVAHTLGFGARLHYDEINRFQRDDTINRSTSGAFTGIDRGHDGSGGNRHQDSTALALWVEDSIQIGNLTLTPGVRYETIDQSFTDYASDATYTKTGGGDGNINYWAPGIGFNYALTDAQRLFGGVYKGYSTPGPRSHLKSGVDFEESLGYELGLRHRGQAVAAEIAGFYTDFDNMIGSAAGLGESSATNAGAADVYGVEALVSYDALANGNSGYALPLYLSATWTHTEMKSYLDSDNDLYSGAFPGAEIPYVPEWKLAGGIGFTAYKWGVNLDASFVSEAFGTASNLDKPETSSREGKIDDALVFDLAAHYQLTKNVRLLAGVQNLFDETYIVSRAPEGPRNGAPRQLYGGFELTF